MSDIISEQADVKTQVRGVRGLIREARYDSQQHSDVSIGFHCTAAVFQLALPIMYN